MSVGGVLYPSSVHELPLPAPNTVPARPVSAIVTQRGLPVAVFRGLCVRLNVTSTRWVSMNSTPVLIPSASMLNVPLQARTADAHLVSLREHFDRLKALEAMIEAQTVQFERNPVDGTRAYLFCSDLVTACVGNSLGPSDDADAVNASRGAMTYDDCCALFYEAHPYLNGPVDEDIIVDWCWPDVPEIERAIDDLYEKLEAFQDSFAGVYGPALSRLHETVGEIGDCVLVVALRVGSLTFEERLLTIFTGAVARGPQLAVVEVCSATAEYLCVERGGVILGQVAMKSEFQGMFAPLVADALPHGELRRYAELSHFGPFEDPTLMAREAVAFLAN